MTPDEFAARMKCLATIKDTESRHKFMDGLMMEALKEEGYKEGVLMFAKAEKWYA